MNHELRTTNRKSFGFTLIELLVVVAILATIAGAIIYSTDNAREKGKDARRKGDLNAIASALVSYYADHGHYPEDGSNPVVLDYASDQNNWLPELNDYLPKRPEDPLQAGLGNFIANIFLGISGSESSTGNVAYANNQISRLDHGRLIARVTAINTTTKTLTVQTMEDPKKIYSVKVAETVTITRPPTPLEGELQASPQAPKASFADIRIGSVVNLITSENPKGEEELTATWIILLV